jgi:hypothetical protein
MTRPNETAMKKKGQRVEGGRFYGKVTADGPLLPAPPSRPDVWVCRRVADFPGHLVPAGGVVGACTRCQAPIVFNPARQATVPATVPRICMQCADIAPLPIEESS